MLLNPLLRLPGLTPQNEVVHIHLTPTEVRIPDFIREGKNTKETAGILGLSPSSVKGIVKTFHKRLD
jgi:DNA-binding CsgD family transcriptional regulator